MDFYEELNNHLKDEYEDVISYAELSKRATGGDAHILRDMAREEFVHAKHLKNILQSAGRLQECSELEKQAEAALAYV